MVDSCPCPSESHFISSPVTLPSHTLTLPHTHTLQGLGEIYEEEYVKAATGFSAPDKQDSIRQQASALFKALCVKLDALSSFTYTPKPVVTELEVRAQAMGGRGGENGSSVCVWGGGRHGGTEGC